MFLMIGAALVFVAIALSLSIIGVVTTERRGVARSVAAIQAMDRAPDIVKQELERPFAERVLGPLGDQLVGTGRKLVRADTAKKLHYRLNVAGNPEGWDVNRLIGLKVLGLSVLGGVGLLYLIGMDWPFYRVLLGTAAIAAFGYCLPNLLLYNAGSKRELLMRNALPDAIDLLTVSVEAGLGFDAAVERVARNTTGPLSEEFARLLQEMQLGVGRVDAMRAMAERSSLEDLKSFCLSMVQADSLGIPIGRVLRIQSQEMRTKRRQRAEEKAQQVPVRMMIPLVLFILPCLFIVILGPAGIQIADTFSKT
ncbi:type II secretion system F family protein [Nocardioides sp. zg-1308]|uniref:Type II secretion system F family protein n=1 Tax=Nocardioides renjunii TaxID=3095075 RepID=A0ABU5KFR9_9ACTN|nr:MULTISPECIES: type II secretion system F family protein [unclassified Nocardioides]MDZ5663813.1 type II secretion system F family protein [Nocardioides sp. S-58]NPD06758.1 type II secretion system F family protein [Nocardioides sp. zg-1308]WQQ20894.1 type II secretion system F family protein [Nocardioides sp. S-34]